LPSSCSGRSLLLAGPALRWARKLRLVPAGPRAIAGYALLACSGFALLFIASTADLLARFTPWRWGWRWRC
jgi:hypothetical protein